MVDQKEVAVKGPSSVAVATAQDWGDTGVTMGQDIVIAKILPMQPSSILVGDNKARIGEFRDSLTGVLLGEITAPFPILPFHVEKFWDIMEDDGKGNFKWMKTEPLVENPVAPGYNDNLPWVDKVNGVAIKRVRRMNFYCMLPSQIASGESVPYIISFKSTSYREGRKLFTQMFMRNKRANLPPCAFVYALGGVKKENDNGKFVVPTLEIGRRASPEEVAECFNWYQTIRKGAVKTDESDVKNAADLGAGIEDEGTGEF